MASKRINQLTELAETPATTDLLPLWDFSTATTKYVTFSNLTTNLAKTNADNTFTATTIFSGTVTVSSSFTSSGLVIHSPITSGGSSGTEDNFAVSLNHFQRWSASGGSRTITGMVTTGTGVNTSGQSYEIWNTGNNNIIINHEDANSTATNRFLTSTGANITIAPSKCALFRYDGFSQRWRVTLLP